GWADDRWICCWKQTWRAIERGINMSQSTRLWFGQTGGGLLMGALLASTVQAAPQQNAQTPKYGISNSSTSSTTQPMRKYGVSSASTSSTTLRGGWDSTPGVFPPMGRDWQRTYPWSPYNAWSNPYWYPPYTRSSPYPPSQAYPSPIPPIYPYPL